MNLIQQADMLKGLSDEQLQSQLSNPSGSVPPFLLTVEAQRRIDARRLVGAKPSDSTVVESLRSQLGGQQPQMSAPPMPQQQASEGQMSQGIGALAPQAQSMPQDIPAFAGGGPVMSNVSSRGPFDYSKWIKTLYDLESFGGKNVVNPESGTFGPYQFKRDTYNGIAKRLGLPLYEGGKPPSLENQKKAYEAGYFQDTLKALKRANVPQENQGTFAYISHKYGQGAVDDIYDAYLQDSEQPISNVLTKLYGKKYGNKAVKQNRLQGMSLADEISRLSQKFGERMPTDINMDENPNIDFGYDAQGNPMDHFTNNMLDSLNREQPQAEEEVIRFKPLKSNKEFEEFLNGLNLMQMGEAIGNGDYPGFAGGGDVQFTGAPETYEEWLKRNSSKEPVIKLGQMFDPKGSNINYGDMISNGPARPSGPSLPAPLPMVIDNSGGPYEITVGRTPIHTIADRGMRINDGLNEVGRRFINDPLHGLDKSWYIDPEEHGSAKVGKSIVQGLYGLGHGINALGAVPTSLANAITTAPAVMARDVFDYLNKTPAQLKREAGGSGQFVQGGGNLEPDTGDVNIPVPVVDDTEILSPFQINAPTSGGGGDDGGYSIAGLKKVYDEVSGLTPKNPMMEAYQNSVNKLLGNLDKEREFNKWMSVATTGFNMMGGAEGEAPFFGNAVRRGTNAGLANYAQGNAEIAKKEMQGIAGLGDLARMEEGRNDKALQIAGNIYEKQLDLRARKISSEVQSKYGSYIPVDYFKMADERAKFDAGLPTDEKALLLMPPAEKEKAMKRYKLLREQYENDLIINAVNKGQARSQKDNN